MRVPTEFERNVKLRLRWVRAQTAHLGWQLESQEKES